MYQALDPRQQQCKESFRESILGPGQEEDPKSIHPTPLRAAGPEALLASPEDFPGTKEKRGEKAPLPTVSKEKGGRWAAGSSERLNGEEKGTGREGKKINSVAQAASADS